jgi:hypothetical protein
MMSGGARAAVGGVVGDAGEEWLAEFTHFDQSKLVVVHARLADVVASGG